MVSVNSRLSSTALQLFGVEQRKQPAVLLSELAKGAVQARDAVSAQGSGARRSAEAAIAGTIVFADGSSVTEDNGESANAIIAHYKAEADAFAAEWAGREQELAEYTHYNSYLAATSADVGYSAPADPRDAQTWAAVAVGEMTSAISEMNHYANLQEPVLEEYVAQFGEKVGQIFYERDKNPAKKLEYARQTFHIGQGTLRSMYGLEGDHLVKGDDGKYSLKPFEVRATSELTIKVEDTRTVTYQHAGAIDTYVSERRD